MKPVAAPLRRGGILATGSLLGYWVGDAHGGWIFLVLTYALAWVVVEIVDLLTEGE
jgi:hypothetical protein